MGFEVTVDAYDRFMGRFSEPLARLFVEWAGVRPGQRALDVGCGPGALTARLVELLGSDGVAAVDPSESFVAAARARFPGLAISRGVAEELPHPDDTFDVALAFRLADIQAEPLLRDAAGFDRLSGTGALDFDLSGAGKSQRKAREPGGQLTRHRQPVHRGLLVLAREPEPPIRACRCFRRRHSP